MSIFPLLLAANSPRAVNIEGIWELDRAASDSLVELVTLCGAPRTICMIAATQGLTLTISVEEDRLFIRQCSGVGDTDRRVVPDGAWRAETTPGGEEEQTRYSWSPDGCFVEQVRTTLGDGAQATLTTTRCSRWAGTLEESVMLEADDGWNIRLTRRYRQR